MGVWSLELVVSLLVEIGRRPALGSPVICVKSVSNLRLYLSALRLCLSAAAADVEERAGRVRRFVGQQPEDRARDFFGGAAPAHRHAGFHTIDSSRLAAAGMNVGMDHAGADGVDANPFLSDFLRQTDRQRID